MARNQGQQRREAKAKNSPHVKRYMRDDARADRRAGEEGHCVVHALLSGVRGLSEASHLSTHTALLKLMRNKVRQGALSKRQVRWNDDELSEQFLRESEEAVQLMQLGNGYLTSSCDPLLVAFASIFNVDVRHNFCGHRFNYSVAEPRRVVYLSSSSGHMSFIGTETVPQMQTTSRANNTDRRSQLQQRATGAGSSSCTATEAIVPTETPSVAAPHAARPRHTQHQLRQYREGDLLVGELAPSET